MKNDVHHTLGGQDKRNPAKKQNKQKPPPPGKKSSFSRTGNIDLGVTCDPNFVYLWLGFLCDTGKVTIIGKKHKHVVHWDHVLYQQKESHCDHVLYQQTESHVLLQVGVWGDHLFYPKGQKNIKKMCFLRYTYTIYIHIYVFSYIHMHIYIVNKIN